MRKGIPTLVIAVASVLLLMLSGCYQPGGPVPEEKHPSSPQAWTQQDVDAAVTMSLEKIYSPAPTTNGTPPDECNYIQYLRFRPKNDSGKIEDDDPNVVYNPAGSGRPNTQDPRN
jgi:hypothetical protein